MKSIEYILLFTFSSAVASQEKRKLIILHDKTFSVNHVSPQKVDMIGWSALLSAAASFKLEILLYQINLRNAFFGVTWNDTSIAGVMSVGECLLGRRLREMSLLIGERVLSLETTPCSEPDNYPGNIPLFAALETRRFVCAIQEIKMWIEISQQKSVRPKFFGRKYSIARDFNSEYMKCLGNDSVDFMLETHANSDLPYTLKMEKARRFLNSREMRVVTIHRPPFIILEVDKSRIISYSGFCIDMLNALADKFNFTYTMELPYDGNWGNPKPNGSIDGMVGMVYRQEVDFAVAGFTITQIRDTVIDFTNAFYEEPTTILLPAPEEENRMFAFLQPYTVQVWVIIWGTLCVVAPIMWVFTTKIPYLTVLYPPMTKVQHDLDRYLWNSAAALVGQSGELRLTGPSRTLFGVWWMVSVILIYTYTSTLIAFLTVPKLKKMIDSLDELSNQREILWTYRHGTAHERLFGSAKPSGTYYKIGSLINENPQLLVKTDAEGVNKVLQKGMAFIKEKSWLDFAMETDYLQTHECRLSQASTFFFSSGFGWVLEEESLYLPLFNDEILRMMQTGLFEKWKKKYWPKPNECTTRSAGAAPKPLQNKNLIGHFLLLGMGFGLALAVLLIERIRHASELDLHMYESSSDEDDIVTIKSPYYMMSPPNKKKARRLKKR